MNIIEKTYNWNGSLGKRSVTDYIVLHHEEAASCTADDVHRWHLNNGWSGIGYHFFVRKDGSIYRGRPVDTVGAHCLGFNSNSIGICAEGAYDGADAAGGGTSAMPEPQKRVLAELTAELKKVYKSAKVVRHCDLMATNCPGRFYPFEEIASGGAAAPANKPLDKQEQLALIKTKAGLSDETVAFLDAYRWGDALIEKLANAMM